MLKHLLKKTLALATSAAMVGVYLQSMPSVEHARAETVTGETSDGIKYSLDTETSEVTITGFTADPKP